MNIRRNGIQIEQPKAKKIIKRAHLLRKQVTYEFYKHPGSWVFTPFKSDFKALKKEGYRYIGEFETEAETHV